MKEKKKRKLIDIPHALAYLSRPQFCVALCSDLGFGTHLLHQREHLLDLGPGEDRRETCTYLTPLGLAGKEEIKGSHLVVPHIAFGKTIREAHEILDEHRPHQLQITDEQGGLMEQIDAHNGLVAETIIEIETTQLQGK